MNVFFIALAFLVSVSSMHAGDHQSPKHRGGHRHGLKAKDVKKAKAQDARIKKEEAARKRAEAALVIKVVKVKQEKAAIKI